MNVSAKDLATIRDFTGESKKQALRHIKQAASEAGVTPAEFAHGLAQEFAEDTADL